MSSIVYVCDLNMLEYHRINGHNAINFWRSATHNNFSDFHEGDYLFFLAKDSRKKGKEKGIMGYGHLKKMYVMSYTQMWKEFTNLNGYATKSDFKQAILRINQGKRIPQRITSLYLENVVFFQHPIYLSEIGINLSNRLESYTYLDREDSEATVKLLIKAKEIGVDVWSAETDDSVFEIDEKLHTIKNIILANRIELSKQHNRSCDKLLSLKDCNRINDISYLGYVFDNNELLLEVAIPKGNNMKELLVGHCVFIKALINKEYPDIKIKYHFINNEKLGDLLNN